jgi:flagellar basal body rod protein FlgB
MRRLWADPEFRERQRASASKGLAARNLANWQDPNYRARMVDMLKRRRISRNERQREYMDSVSRETSEPA